MKIIFALITLCFMTLAFARDEEGKRVYYEYKKYEKFDFGVIDVEGGGNSPGDLSISPRFRKKFRNKIPERRQFNNEMKKALDSIR